MKFSKDDKQCRDVLVSVRFTKDQHEALEDLSKELGIIGGKAELIRQAIDFWIANDRGARQAVNRLQKQRGE